MVLPLINNEGRKEKRKRVFEAHFLVKIFCVATIWLRLGLSILSKEHPNIKEHKIINNLSHKHILLLHWAVIKNAPCNLLLKIFMIYMYIVKIVTWKCSQSANVFVFGDFNVHHKDWLTYSCGTDRPGELCYNFSISKDLTQIVNFPTQISDCDSHSPALLDLFLSSDASICSTMAFPPLGNSDHVVVSVSIDFPINSKQDSPFHGVAYDNSRADWDGLRDHLRDVPWENIFKLGASTAASEFCEWVQVGIDVYMSKSSESKVKFRQASNRCKRVLEAAKLAYATKTKESITSQKLGSRDFW